MEVHKVQCIAGLLRVELSGLSGLACLSTNHAEQDTKPYGNQEDRHLSISVG